MHKDELAGSEVIDYDFLGKKLYPPKKLHQTDAGKEIAAFFRTLDRLYYPSPKNKDDSMIHFYRGHAAQKQPCTVKMFYTESREKHVEFLRNYMPQKNKKSVEEKPVLFNDKYDVVPESEILKYEEEADALGFKFIISPESQNVNMKLLVRQFVKNLEGVTGFKFSWMAVTHTDTGHIHSHVLINGIDKRSKEKIRFEPAIVKNVARSLAMDICTNLVGRRSQEAIEAARSQLPYAKRWTKIDEHIESYYGYTEFSSPKLVGDAEYSASKATVDDLEIQRLNILVQMGLAICYSKERPPLYYLEKGWKDKLRAIGRYNTYLDARSKLRLVPQGSLELYSGEMGEISGIVTNVYNMNDEDVWNNAVVIENKKENKAWYIPTRIKLNEEDVGKFISVKAERNQKGKLRPLIKVHS